MVGIERGQWNFLHFFFFVIYNVRDDRCTISPNKSTHPPGASGWCAAAYFPMSATGCRICRHCPNSRPFVLGFPRALGNRRARDIPLRCPPNKQDQSGCRRVEGCAEGVADLMGRCSWLDSPRPDSLLVAEEQSWKPKMARNDYRRVG